MGPRMRLLIAIVGLLAASYGWASVGAGTAVADKGHAPQPRRPKPRRRPGGDGRTFGRAPGGSTRVHGPSRRLIGSAARRETTLRALSHPVKSVPRLASNDPLPGITSTHSNVRYLVPATQHYSGSALRLSIQHSSSRQRPAAQRSHVVAVESPAARLTGLVDVDAAALCAAVPGRQHAAPAAPVAARLQPALLPVVAGAGGQQPAARRGRRGVVASAADDGQPGHARPGSGAELASAPDDKLADAQ